MDTHRSLGSLVPGNTSRAFRRQQSTHFNTDPNNPTSSRTPQTVVEGMISSGSQCNVRSGPLPTPTSAMWLDPIIEPDDNLNFDPPCVDLEVDEAYCAGNLPDGDEMAWIESVMSLRRASTPGGIRKNRYLPYRPSADAGMRCANVVRNRPRMRRRKKLGPNSKASSAISSPISSPVIPPSLPDELGH
ncbi:hypothetical protein QBC33DRAFT_526707 [Phialemonium atrogriseum]|uniref:Uncharacterized protein n=1 Tax=Phialemonium atrogriseum TaxID=1093897 RepID=A0AAJ0C7R0_9PEZI|nr:uncharacterized protein QBC33DRAFT_526707 [Phialemonium atrogriseum]KAK1771062.1 hypothetical protein QBC33DRAFT_526707 [Phialemonium atrogriseum]